MDTIEDGGPTGIPPKGKAVIACAIITSGIAGLVVASRFFTRLCPARLLGKEDWCILTAWWAYLTIILYNIGLACVKVSILLLYLRILGDLNYRKACYIALSIVVAVSLWTVLSSILFCVPISRNWDRSVPGVCFSRGPNWFANASLNVATDFMILVLPLPILPKVKQSRQQKISLYLIFALGFLYLFSICIVSILRIPSLIITKYTHDPTMDSPDIAQWSIVELNTAIVCASLITLKPLVARFFPRLLGLKQGVGREHSPGLEEMPATVGSKESRNGRPNHARTGSGGSTIRLNHDTFGGGSMTNTQSSQLNSAETSDLEKGVKAMAIEHDSTTQKA
ncbi:PTH11-like integral membrane protein [Colletotrichum tofieldiae]|uniref:PTH11-like integral membrane protein n=1 Tax=Colletotrichum tofieldiae TaxID=708197 RepID=A0A161YP25_9PEZI|nr:PTH11-like integral membrane protein [Colletotrichum tofieldiae]GKT66901.1 PTH11-like integral membrane protein [Colletotrichum tofieldiae]